MAELAGKAEDSLQIAAGLENRSWEELLDDDTFESIDRKILSDLAAGVAGKTISAREVVEADRRRHSTFWYSGYEPLYTAIRSASELLAAIDAFNPAMASFDDGSRSTLLAGRRSTASIGTSFTLRGRRSTPSRWSRSSSRWRTSTRTSMSARSPLRGRRRSTASVSGNH